MAEMGQNSPCERFSSTAGSPLIAVVVDSAANRREGLNSDIRKCHCSAEAKASASGVPDEQRIGYAIRRSSSACADRRNLAGSKAAEIHLLTPLTHIGED